jgi:hypothetical protein
LSGEGFVGFDQIQITQLPASFFPGNAWSQKPGRCP